MGPIRVPVIIRNPIYRDRAWEGMFLVDTGATDCLVPKRHLEPLGLEPVGQRVYELADGSELQVDITAALVEVMGQPVGATIIMAELTAEGDIEPLLGVTALESAGIEVDPRNETLKRLPSVRLKPISTLSPSVRFKKVEQA